MKVFNQKQLAMTLIGLGTIPFLVLAPLVVLARPLPYLTVSPAQALHLYGAVMASFVAGLHWGIHFCKRTEDSVYLSSSFIALLVWCSMAFAGTAPGLGLVLLGFLLLWLVEYRLSLQRVTTSWFWQWRSGASALVALCLLAAMLFV